MSESTLQGRGERWPALGMKKKKKRSKVNDSATEVRDDDAPEEGEKSSRKSGRKERVDIAGAWPAGASQKAKRLNAVGRDPG